MVKTTLQDRTLPEDFGQRLLAYPFPRLQPEIEIVELPGAFEVRCTDAQSHFVPLTGDGKCDWTFYDWPEGRLTGVYECHIVSSAKGLPIRCAHTCPDGQCQGGVTQKAPC